MTQDSNQDARWKQRFNKYVNALNNISEAIKLKQQRSLSDLEKQGVIQSFEYTHELSWNVLKDLLAEQGVANIAGSKDAVRKAIERGIIKNDLQLWIDMTDKRNQTVHAYDSEILERVFKDIVEKFHPAFKNLETDLKKRYEQD